MQIHDDIANSVKVLREGGIILYPTDTVWGIGCDARNKEAVERIYKVKKRNEDKSMIILLADEEEIMHYSRQKNLQIYDYVKGISKPATVIYDEAYGLAPNLINKDGSIGIRIVTDPFCVSLIRSFGGPVVSTSSNVSGYPPPAFFCDIDRLIIEGVDYIVQHRQDDPEPGIPSTVIRLKEDGSFTVIRP
ncbi:MAG: L-threonylcarbamoyladenylate synthase [Sphingobacteriales bacterium]|jgi:L-threonylcarbamoyladenylate synthase|nr:L-threonylcarbamoyladenylate synthase [Sphingobacteriales bacterium]